MAIFFILAVTVASSWYFSCVNDIITSTSSIILFIGVLLIIWWSNFSSIKGLDLIEAEKIFSKSAYDDKEARVDREELKDIHGN